MSALLPWLLRGYKTADLQDVKVALVFELKYVDPECGTEHVKFRVVLANDHLGHGFTGVWQAQGVFTLMENVDKDACIRDRSEMIDSMWQCSRFPYARSNPRKHAEHFARNVRMGGWRHILSDYLLGKFFKHANGLRTHVSLLVAYYLWEP